MQILVTKFEGIYYLIYSYFLKNNLASYNYYFLKVISVIFLKTCKFFFGNQLGIYFFFSKV